jgi:hypothetical protein
MLDVKEDHSKQRLENLNNNGVILGSQTSASIENKLRQNEILKTNLRDDISNFNQEIKKLEKAESKLVSQGNRAPVEGSLLDDYADLSFEMMQIIDFD